MIALDIAFKPGCYIDRNQNCMERGKNYEYYGFAEGMGKFGE
ncbi:hypothetical protein SFMTTN_0192 [Sulfuriferula multivorans]|uniref:Uncharacterized protein n=2 Tax=Sulfuriferula multivorans TaxID=1559896 RepID=A0A401J9U6_9PROT|nr:hypothetical protein SFMTTN_0192 [Sulfuriferula multivorans]